MAPLHCFNHGVLKSDGLENHDCPFAEGDISRIFEPSVKRCVYLSRRRSNFSAGAPDCLSRLWKHRWLETERDDSWLSCDNKHIL